MIEYFKGIKNNRLPVTYRYYFLKQRYVLTKKVTYITYNECYSL